MGGRLTNSDRNDFGNILAKRPKDIDMSSAIKMSFDKFLGNSGSTTGANPDFTRAFGGSAPNPLFNVSASDGTPIPINLTSWGVTNPKMMQDTKNMLLNVIPTVTGA